MPAANTDKFRKVAPNTGWQLGPSGIADASVDNFALVAATGLPEDTAVELTIDRVDSSGNKTPALMERIVGIVSSDNIINCVRGVEGTAQAHSGGAVVEIVISADSWNDIVDGILAEHGQDGKHITPLLEGQMENGYILPSVDSGNLTLALKHIDNDGTLSVPSALKPIRVKIGGIVRTITSALTFTRNGDDNYCNAGAGELAGKEIPYFVFLVWKESTSTMYIGYSRLHWATSYGSFGGTSTGENHIQIGSACAATDSVANIGRFPAIMAATTYDYSLPALTNNNLIQKPCYETGACDFGLVLSAAGGSPTIGNGSFEGKYKIVGRTMKVEGRITWGSTTSVGTGQWGFYLPWLLGTSMGVLTSGRVRRLNFHVFESGVDNYNGWLYNDSPDRRIDAFIRHESANKPIYDGVLGQNVIPGETTVWSAGDELDFWGEFEI